MKNALTVLALVLTFALILSITSFIVGTEKQLRSIENTIAEQLEQGRD